MLIDRVVDERALAGAVARFRERGILLPTFAQLRQPGTIPSQVRQRLSDVGLWDLDPCNLFRITWHNAPVAQGGGYGGVNQVLLPPVLTGVDAPIIALVGKWFPTGAHKVGAAYGCLAPRIVTGQFNPETQKAVWPSTGNYCRGGAFDSHLMGCTAVAILPEEMSRERFEWLQSIGAEVIATPGCESNIKEIYDKCWELRRTRPECVIFNQFDEFGNACWHYTVTGAAIEETWRGHAGGAARLAAFVSATGSAGTIAAGDYLREIAPLVKVVASEALQCPTLFMNGFGGHRIEGIGDKHVPWIHNVRNTDAVTAIDDTACLRLFRLFNEEAGRDFLCGEGLAAESADALELFGISSIANILASIKTAKYFELGPADLVVTVATDSAALYQSRLAELRAARGPYTREQAAGDYAALLRGAATDYYKELSYRDRKALHNLKYFTWVEQQGKDVVDLQRQWDDREFWPQVFAQPQRWDELIEEFNAATGLATTHGQGDGD